MKIGIRKMDLLLLILLTVISIPVADPAEMNGIGITAMEVTPQPAEPGGDLTLKIRVTNEGVEKIEDFSVRIDVRYPFHLKSESGNFENKRTLSVGSSVDNTYYLTVDPDAISGIYPIEFDIYANDVIINPPDNKVYVQVTGKPDLTIKAAYSNNVAPGDVFPLNISVNNIGTGMAKNVKVISESESILMLGSNVELIKQIMPSEAEQIECRFIVKNELDPDAHQFPIMLKYSDEQGGNYTLTYNIGINILNRADIGIQSIKVTPTAITPLDEVNIAGIIENTGNGDAKEVVVELEAEGRTYKSFIGQLRSDDDSPFYFYIDPGSAGEKDLNLTIYYTDDFGSYEIWRTVPMTVERPRTNVLMLIALLIIIAIPVAYMIYRRRRGQDGKQ
ncbi:COG1361 S-layer family protein [Methanolobus chelungpuianus]|uniref:S-layer protein n=1 Tax=Methanolobus chelungpuianus TaxID=502115 RepID=A0AAE3KVM1_9EURY|nr:S-layer protein [Methanolobus chelungpuianus]MCQ6961910.1 S-layer protein [Methanolobus chelungpuianus]